MYITELLRISVKIIHLASSYSFFPSLRLPGLAQTNPLFSNAYPFFGSSTWVRRRRHSPHKTRCAFSFSETDLCVGTFFSRVVLYGFFLPLTSEFLQRQTDNDGRREGVAQRLGLSSRRFWLLGCIRLCTHASRTYLADAECRVAETESRQAKAAAALLVFQATNNDYTNSVQNLGGV